MPTAVGLRGRGVAAPRDSAGDHAGASDSPRVLLVSADFPPSRGGVQTLTSEIAARLVRRGSALEVVAPSCEGASRFDATLPYRVHRLGCSSDALGFVALPAVASIARAGRFDVALHAQWSTAPSSLAARSMTGWPRRIVSIAHARELLVAPWRRSPIAQRAYDVFRRHVCRRVDAHIAVSRFTGSLLRDVGVAPERVRVALAGTDPLRFRPRDARGLREQLGLGGARVLLTVSRLVRRKGIDLVIAAMPRLLARYPDLVYAVVGVGPARDELAALARERGVQGCVRFIGDVTDDELPLWHAAADVYVMPTRADAPDIEGFGLVYLDASATARPVVAAASGGATEAVLDGETGLVVPPEDERALTRAMLRLLDEPDLAARLGAAGRARVERELTWDHAATRYLSCLASRDDEAAAGVAARATE